MKAPLFNVVLSEPEIPNNTGNIGRTCVGARSKLHLIEPFGFEINDKQLRRAGLDYWPHLDWQTYKNWQDFSSVTEGRKVFFSSKAELSFFDFDFQFGDWLIFGPETRGLDPEVLNSEKGTALTIPMLGPIRSHNLANSVSIVLYEALRQTRENWQS